MSITDKKRWTVYSSNSAAWKMTFFRFENAARYADKLAVMGFTATVWENIMGQVYEGQAQLAAS